MALGKFTNTPTRHQLMHRLLQEQKHLRLGSNEFREALVIRSIYVVGSDMGRVASFTGYRKEFVKNAMRRHNVAAMRALRAYVNGKDYQPTITETVSNIKRQIGGYLAKKFGGSIGKSLGRLAGARKG